MSSNLNISALEHFDCDGDVCSVGSRWERWKRAFSIYLEAASIDNPSKKRATLLHMGGLSLQEIYYNIPGAHVEDTAEGDVYDIAMQKLDEYFSPKQSRVFERHIFRLMKQETGEKFEKFLVRLRNQAEKCKFQHLEDNLIDQIVEKGNCLELRKKILAIGDNITLDTIISEANSLEAVKRQLDEFIGNQGPPQTINLLQQITPKPHASRECSRCGSNRHPSSSEKCPAINEKCRKCGYRGHFMLQCKTSANKRKQVENKPKYGKPQTSFKRKKPSHIRSIEEDIEEETDYVFHIDQEETITCHLGGVQIEMLIDSGSKSNLISEEVWKYLKRMGVQVSNQIKNPDKIFMAYASKKPLKVLGSFHTNISAGDKTATAKFYVI